MTVKGGAWHGQTPLPRDGMYCLWPGKLGESLPCLSVLCPTPRKPRPPCPPLPCQTGLRWPLVALMQPLLSPSRCPNLVARHGGSDADGRPPPAPSPLPVSLLASGSEWESCPELPQAHVMARELHTLRRRRPPRSCGGGSGASAGCSQMPQGRSCGPRRRRPCHHSSWMRSSGCPRAVRVGELPRGRAIGPGDEERRWHSPRSPGSWLCTSPATSA